MNSVVLIGRITRDIELRYTGDDERSAVATFNIAIDRPPRKDGTKETDFPRITVFGRQAVNCEKYLSKGKQVGIQGRIQTGSYTNKNGDKVYTTDVIADRVEFLSGASEPKSHSEQSNMYQGNFYQPKYENPPQAKGQPQDHMQNMQPQPNLHWDDIDDSDIPF